MSTPATLAETVLEPDLPILDPHHHLWDHRSYLPDSSEPITHAFEHVPRRTPCYLLPELLQDVYSGHNVRATVYLECGSMYRRAGPEALRPLGETEFVNGAAAMAASGLYGDVRACAGIVGHVDLELTGTEAAAVIEAHVAAGGGRFRGIRHCAQFDVDPTVLGPIARGGAELYRSKRFREGFACLAPLRMSFDAFLLEPQLPDLIDLAREFPDTSIVLDHVGTPLGIGRYTHQLAARFSIWRDNIRSLAGLPNVTIKLGGLGMVLSGFPSFMQNPPASSEQLAAEWTPYFETCIEAFGVDRCMFESNFPVDRCTCSYRTLWNSFKRIVSRYSPAEKTALFSGTACTVYRLTL